jgi:hypothetical protein
MDLTKILKVGDVVYTPLFGDVAITSINRSKKYSITAYAKGFGYASFTSDVKPYESTPECLLFPSKDNRDWSSIFKFKNGDVIVSECGNIAIFSHVGTIGDRHDVVFYHCLLPPIGSLKVKIDCGVGRLGNCSLASDHQKERIFKALKANSYKWNDETGTIEKIVSFKPFDKVLVRDDAGYDQDHWCCDFFSHIDDNDCFVTSGGEWSECIPYNKETQHLVGTNQDCPDKYKIW